MQKTIGSGKGACILFQDNGIGDVICFLPALWQKIQEGFEVTVYCRESHAPIFGKFSVQIKDGAAIEGQLGTIEILQKEYSEIFNYGQFCLEHEEETKGNLTLTRLEQFAKALETSVPEKFDFSKFFELGEKKKDKVLLATWSRSRCRAYGQTEELYDLFYEAYNEGAIDIIPECIGLYMQPQKEFKELIQEIYSAALVVAIDNGILHLALALGTPVLALMGGSDEWAIIHQYRRFGINNYEIIRSSVKNKECERPCSFQLERGYGRNNKCSTGHSDCMDEILPEDIYWKAKQFLTLL